MPPAIGETPYTVSLFTFDDLVDTVRPGDRLEVTGIFRALPRRLNSHMTTMRSIYKTYVDAVHFKYVDFLVLNVKESYSLMQWNIFFM